MSTEGCPSKDISPTINSDTAARLGAAFDQGSQQLVKEKAGRTYFAIAEILTSLHRSQSLEYIREQVPALFADEKKEKYIKGAAFVGGVAVGLLIARKTVGKGWDDKLTEGFQKTSQLITEGGRSLRSICQEGFNGQDDAARTPLERMAGTAYPDSESPEADDFMGGIGFVRAALRNIPAKRPKRAKGQRQLRNQRPIESLDEESISYASSLRQMLRQI